jgi:hypothetical protein
MDRIAAFREGSVHGWNRITRAVELRVGFPANLAKSDAQELLDRDNLRRGWNYRTQTGEAALMTWIRHRVAIAPKLRTAEFNGGT